MASANKSGVSSTTKKVVGSSGAVGSGNDSESLK